MKINIYQIAPERDNNGVIYVDSQYLRRHQGNTAIDSSIYDKIYGCEIDCKSLEDIFAKFNISIPSDYRGRSISISDVIEVVEDSEVKKGFYYCNSFGFKKINVTIQNDKKLYTYTKEILIYRIAGMQMKEIQIGHTLCSPETLKTPFKNQVRQNVQSSVGRGIAKFR